MIETNTESLPASREAVHAQYRRNGWWRDRTFLDDLRDTVRSRPDRPAVIARDTSGGDDVTRTLTYAELAAMTDRCAGALTELGVRPGDFVAVQLPNRWELVPLMLGCMRVGARLCPLVTDYRRRELEYMLRLTEARVFITMSDAKGTPLGEMALELAADLPNLRHVLVTAGPDGKVPHGALDFEETVFGTEWEHGYQTEHELGPDDPCLILFTSGTTGEPKGVLHTMNTLHSAVRAEADVFELGGDSVISIASIYTGGSAIMQGMLIPLLRGGTAAFQDTWAGPQLLELIERHHVTFLFATPTYLLDLLDAQRARPRDTSSLRHIATGSAPIPPHLVDEVREVFGVRLSAIWAMTENLATTMTRLDDPDDWAKHSDGRPIDSMEVRIAPLPGAPEGDGGRLLSRGASQCLGYYRRAELYATHLDADGWFMTGDLARPDGRGGIRITGREKDLVMPRGFPVPVTEVEAVLGTHPNIREVAVIGIRGTDDEVLCAVVTAVGEPPSLRELRDYLDEAGMTKLFWPERLEVVDTLPKTITGKIRKTELQQWYQNPAPPAN
ncbi:cyclohexanecarboxylate-CoA ligase [Rugosimonospora acidiphila]|uniref:Cyclohexanecarboxylate-CoA ligase n=1 Tax=Rugosimonospora acidiphila TaxID=556531 RepID=A0ABP9S6T4_9ACTN